MRQKAIGIILIFLIQIFTINAQECQYTETITLVNLAPYDNTGEALQNFQITLGGWNEPLTIFNPNDIQMTAVIKLTTTSMQTTEGCLGTSETVTKEFLINPGRDTQIEVEPFNDPNCQDYRYSEVQIIEYGQTESVKLYETEQTQTQTICKGKNDGEGCLSAAECGSGGCSSGRCTSEQKGLTCQENQIKCSDKCVLEGTKQIGEKTTCSNEKECASGKINQKGECEENQQTQTTTKNNQQNNEGQQNVNENPTDKKTQIYAIGIIVMILIAAIIGIIFKIINKSKNQIKIEEPKIERRKKRKN